VPRSYLGRSSAPFYEYGVAGLDVLSLIKLCHRTAAPLALSFSHGPAEQIEGAERWKDSYALEALNAKADSLERQISPEYTKVMDGLEEVDQIPPRASNLSLQSILL
jgi:hypothetical protein